MAYSANELLLHELKGLNKKIYELDNDINKWRMQITTMKGNILEATATREKLRFQLHDKLRKA